MSDEYWKKVGKHSHVSFDGRFTLTRADGIHGNGGHLWRVFLSEAAREDWEEKYGKYAIAIGGSFEEIKKVFKDCLKKKEG